MSDIIGDLPHFDISAAVVKQLGEELVTDEVTAVMELVKNSYDACAQWVRIEVNTSQPLLGQHYKYQGDVGYITIEDNGFGMNEIEIKKGWLVISLSAKRKMKEAGQTLVCGRTPLGDKGLGRLSTQRLAQRLELFSSKPEDSEVHHVAFDWSDFNEETPLSQVPTYYANVKKQHQPKGTKIVLTKLRDSNSWEGASADRFKGQLSQLIFPFKERRAFHLFLTINNEKVDLDELSEALRNQAVSRFEFHYDGKQLTVKGSVKAYKLFGGAPSPDERDNYQRFISNDNGQRFFTFLVDQKRNKSNSLDKISYSGNKGVLYDFLTTIDVDNIGGKSYTIDPDNRGEVLANPGRFFGEIDDFNLREADTLDSAFDNFSQFKNIVKNQIGVRVFRDGFGIKPFGIDGEDWLKLGSSWTSGGSYYGLKPSNTIGFVALSAKENYNLKEKTDREGFMDTPYSKNFFLLMNQVVNIINGLLEKTRRSYNDYKKFSAQQAGEITDIKDSYKRLQQTSDRSRRVQAEAYQLTPTLARVAQSVRQVIKKVEHTKPSNAQDAEQRKLMLEIDHSLQRAMDILTKVDSILDVAKKIEHDVAYIRPRVEDLETQLGEFAELAGLGLTAEALSHEISNIVDRLLEQTNNISRKIRGKEMIDTSPVFVYVEYVKSAIQSFRKQLSHLAPSLRYVRESKEAFDINDYFTEIGSYYNQKFAGSIELELRHSKVPFQVRMSKGKLTQIIDNLILNSEFWLKEARSANSSFKPKIVIELKSPFIRIFDNGPGIDPGYENRIFQPFVTSKPRNLGRGLGLFVVQQLLDTVGGDILLLDERNIHKRRYIFQIDLSQVVN